jgi:DNA-binding NarL/FixJ family response regulator
MAGGTLLVTRAVNLHNFYKTKIEGLGYRDVSITAADRDALNFAINEQKPRLVLMASEFYQCATPYMTSLLLKTFPGLNVAAVSMGDYPADLAMYFIANGVNSCLQWWDGDKQFFNGLDSIKNGEQFISASVLESIERRREMPMAATELTERQLEVVRLSCNGFEGVEIADTLHISWRTVKTLKREIYRCLNVRNAYEMIKTAFFAGIVKPDELCFSGGKCGVGKQTVEKRKAKIKKILEGNFL